MGNAYKDIIAMVNNTSKKQTLTEQFVADVEKTMQVYKQEHKPSKTIKPSMLGGCAREQVFVILGEHSDVGKLEKPEMVCIGESGTDRHVRLQNVCMSASLYAVPLTWVDPEQEVKIAQSKGIHTIVRRHDGNEVLCYNKDFNMSFKCDGIILYRNKTMILEIKTEDHFKWAKRVDAEPKHKFQAICYSLAFGIPDIMFLYEDRNFCTHKAYHVVITDEQRKTVLSEIHKIIKYANMKKLPDKEKKCTYCNYKQACKKYGPGEHEWKE